MKGSDHPAAGAVLLTAAGLSILIVVLAVSSLDGSAISFAATTTPMAQFIGFGLIACGVSAWLQPSTRTVAGVLWILGGLGATEYSLINRPPSNDPVENINQSLEHLRGIAMDKLKRFTWACQTLQPALGTTQHASKSKIAV